MTTTTLRIGYVSLDAKCEKDGHYRAVIDGDEGRSRWFCREVPLHMVRLIADYPHRLAQACDGA